MEFLSTAWWSALLAIILIDLVLAGDNAIVIALAARRLPPALQKQAIVWGTFGAIAVRIYHKPLVLLIWWGPVLMAFGGVLSLSDRRLRVGAPKPARAKQRLQPAE